MIDWGQTAVNVLGVGVPIFIYLAANKHSARLDTERRHKENQKKLDELTSERMYLKPHDHIEEDGPLTADGIIRKRNGT